VNLKKAADLFEPYVSDPERVLYASLDGSINKEHAFVLGTGSGLGLNIVKQIVQARQGKAEFVAPSDGWNTELVIEI
jgi:signal transduction histidine kinase